jgi:hypothetical protein
MSTPDTTHAESEHEHSHGHPVRFTEDGEPLEIETDSLTMSEILALVGKKPDEWYLVEKVGREQKTFRDPDQQITITEGAQFVSVFTGPTPVS